MSHPSRQKEFTELLAVCQPRVMACIYALIHNIHETEDVYQQACMVMWRKFDTYRPETQFVKWACEIAYFEAMNYLRQRRSKPHFSHEFALDFAAWEIGLPVDDDDSLVQSLYSCMDRLNESDRHLLQLRYWGPSSIAEIAVQLGRTPQSVCNSLSRIRAQLLECVERSVSAEDRT